MHLKTLLLFGFDSSCGPALLYPPVLNPSNVISSSILPSSAQAQAQLGAEIALFSQLWGTYGIRHTPYTLHPE